MPRVAHRFDRIAVIGGGWFGCCIATELVRLGFDVRVFERAGDLFRGASGHNQFRLHLGFHYPRSHRTREQTRVGFRWFLREYPQFSAPVSDNVYGVCTTDSLIDFETYCQVLRAARLRFELRDPIEYELHHVEGCLTCPERRILTDDARKWFRESLRERLSLETAVESIAARDDRILVNGEPFGLAVNCSNQLHSPHAGWSVIYEPCVTLVYEGPADHPALTLMDGPFFTIFPYRDRLFTVYSVVHSRCGRFARAAEAAAVLNGLTADDLRGIQARIEDVIRPIYPAFFDRFRCVDAHRTIRSIFPDRSDARPCCVAEEGRLVQIMAGKIDAVCFAVEQVTQCAEKYCSPADRRGFARSSGGLAKSA